MPIYKKKSLPKARSLANNNNKLVSDAARVRRSIANTKLVSDAARLRSVRASRVRSGSYKFRAVRLKRVTSTRPQRQSHAKPEYSMLSTMPPTTNWSELKPLSTTAS